MKSILWFVGGFAAVAAIFLLKNLRSNSAEEPVDQLTRKLQDAYADHHTVA